MPSLSTRAFGIGLSQPSLQKRKMRTETWPTRLLVWGGKISRLLWWNQISRSWPRLNYSSIFSPSWMWFTGLPPPRQGKQLLSCISFTCPQLLFIVWWTSTVSPMVNLCLQVYIQNVPIWLLVLVGLKRELVIKWCVGRMVILHKVMQY